MRLAAVRVVSVGVVVAGFAAVVGAGTAAAAAPAVITYNGGDIVYRAAMGQSNQVVVTQPAAGVLVFDDVVAITANTDPPGSCVYYADVDGVVRDRTRMQCVDRGGRLNVYTYDRADLIDNRTAGPVETLAAGAGDDIVRLGGGPGVVVHAAGGPGNDLFYSGPGSDAIDGGDDVDTVSYQGRYAVITADLDAPFMLEFIAFTGHGGAPGETDGYLAIENITGGGGADRITGNDLANVLDGGSATVPCGSPPCATFSGHDTLVGAGGPDVLLGQDGDDLLYGGAQYDTMDGGTGSNRCFDEAAGATVVRCALTVLVRP